MSLVPQYCLNSFTQTALDKFGDPGDGVSIFQAAMHKKSGAENILALYGLSHNNQRQLCQQIIDAIEADMPHAITCTLSFTSATSWDPAQELLTLREVLHQKYDVNFPVFDVAYCIFWYKKNQGLKLNRTNLSPPGKKGSFLDRMVAGLDKEHGVNWEKIIYDTIQENSDIHKNQFKALYSLPGMSCTEIINWLPAFLGDDIKRFYTKTGEKIFILLQRFDLLFWDTSGSSTLPGSDSWLRELILQLPDVTWVIFSLTKIPWGEYSSDWDGILKQFLAGPLNDIDTRKHLVENGIIEKAAQDKIITASRGIPFYLDLLLSMPVSDLNLFPVHAPDSIHPWILNKYLDELNPAERRTLHILACAGVWEEDLLDRLIITFSAHFYLSSLHELSRFPFILPGRLPSTHIMHPVMQEHLLGSGDYDLQRDIRQFLFYHYTALLPHDSVVNTNQLEQFNFEQSCHHGSFIMSPQEFVLWFYQASIVYMQTGEYALLLPLLEKYLPLAEKTIESNPGETAYYYSSLAECYSAAGDYHQAEQMAVEALEIRQNNLGPLDTDILDSLKQLGWIYKNQNRSIESLFFFKQVFNKCQKKYGLEHHLTAAALYNLASIYKEDSRLSDAEFWLKQALEIQETTLGSCHEETISSLNQLESVYELQNKPEKLLGLYQHSLLLRQEELGAENIASAEMMWRLATGFLLQGLYREAEPLLVEAGRISRGKLPPDHPIMKAIFTNTAALYQILGKFNLLEDLYVQRLDEMMQNLNPLHPEVKGLIFKVAEFYQLRKQYEKIITLFEEVLQHQKKQSIPMDYDAAVILYNLGRLYRFGHRYEEARQAFQQAIQIFKTSGNVSTSPSMADMFRDLAELHEVLENLEDAEYCYLRVLRLTRALPNWERSDVCEVIQKINDIRDKKRNSPVCP